MYYISLVYPMVCQRHARFCKREAEWMGAPLGEGINQWDGLGTCMPLKIPMTGQSMVHLWLIMVNI